MVAENTPALTALSFLAGEKEAQDELMASVNQALAKHAALHEKMKSDEMVEAPTPHKIKGLEEYHVEQAASEQAAREKAASEQAAREKAASEQAASEQAALAGVSSSNRDDMETPVRQFGIPPSTTTPNQSLTRRFLSKLPFNKRGGGKRTKKRKYRRTKHKNSKRRGSKRKSRNSHKTRRR